MYNKLLDSILHQLAASSASLTTNIIVCPTKYNKGCWTRWFGFGFGAIIVCRLNAFERVFKEQDLESVNDPAVHNSDSGEPFQTVPNKFGLFCRYIKTLSYVPADETGWEPEHPHTPKPSLRLPPRLPPRPPQNLNIIHSLTFHLANWFITATAAGTLSEPLFDQLLDCIRHPQFRTQDCEGLTYCHMLDLLKSADHNNLITWSKT